MGLNKFVKHWNFEGLSENPSITMEFVEKHFDKDLYWGYGLSRNPSTSLTMEFLEKHIDKNWSYYGLSRNPSITMEFLKNWSYYGLSKNPRITMEFLKCWKWGGIRFKFKSKFNNGIC